MVLRVRFQVLGQVLDTGRQNGDLDFRATGIRGTTSIGLNNPRLLIFCYRHLPPAAMWLFHSTASYSSFFLPFYVQAANLGGGQWEIKRVAKVLETRGRNRPQFAPLPVVAGILNEQSRRQILVQPSLGPSDQSGAGRASATRDRAGGSRPQADGRGIHFRPLTGLSNASPFLQRNQRVVGGGTRQTVSFCQLGYLCTTNTMGG
jgi:hypothetical protein